MILGKPDEECLVATVSSICPKGCILDFEGNVGTLLVNETCPSEKDGFGGCHIKEDQGMYIIQRCYYQ